MTAHTAPVASKKTTALPRRPKLGTATTPIAITSAPRKDVRVSAAQKPRADMLRQSEEIRRMQLDLVESQRRYERLVSCIDGIVWEADAETSRFSFVSEKAERLLGYPLRLWLDEADFWHDRIHPDDRDWVVAYCARSARERRPRDIEYRMVAADGRVVWLRDVVTVACEHDRSAKIHGVMIDVSERKHRETESHRIEQQLRHIVENLNDVVYSCDRSGRFTYVSPAIERLAAYTIEEFRGKNFRSFIHPDDLTTVEASFFDTLSGNPATFEFRAFDKSGETYWARASHSPLFEGGEVIGVTGVFSDITARKLAAEALEESEGRYRNLVEMSPEGIAIHCDGRVVFVNRVGAELLGAESADEILGRPVMDIVHPDSRATVAARMQQILTEWRPGPRIHERFVRVDGIVVDVEVMAMPLTYQGRPAVQVIVEDVTERKRASEALRESEERYRTLFENAHDLIYFHDMEGNFRAFNRAAERVTGYTREEATGAVNLAKLIAPEDLPLVDGLVEQLRSGGTPAASFESAIITKDGRRVALEISTQPLRRNGRLIGVQGIARDITERKRAQEEIRRLNSELEQRVRDRTTQFENATKEMEAFSYSVSHDLRAPLRVIEGFSHLFLEEFGQTLDNHARHYIERVHATSLRMGELIHDLLALSRVTRISMYRTRVDLSAVARSIAAELRQASPDRDVDFQIADGVSADGDSSLLAIVMQNLLENAWKYTSRQPHAHVQFGADQSNGRCVYFVRDDGAGFDMRYVAKLFGAFQRLHSADEFEGTGIGLATVQRIVQRHGGRVWAEGAENRGATFYFTLPPLRWKSWNVERPATT